MFKNSKTKLLHHRDQVMIKEELKRADWPERNDFLFGLEVKGQILDETLS